MSISTIDVAPLEMVQHFKGFLQLMQEPDKYKTFLTETDRLLAEQKKYLGLIQTKNHADAYLAAAHAKIDAWVKEDEKAKTEFAASQETQKAEVASTLGKAQYTLTEAQDKLTDATKQFASAQAAVAVVTQKLADLKERELAIAVSEAELTEKREILEKRITQIEKMLKG